MKPSMDRIDSRIIAELQKNARLSNKELAAMINLAASSCLQRVRRLQQEGILQGFHASVNPEALGIGLQAMVSVRLKHHSRDLAGIFWQHLESLVEVVAAYHIAGVDDFMLQVAVRDVEHLRNFILDCITAREEVTHVETALIFQHQRGWALPEYG